MAPEEVSIIVFRKTPRIWATIFCHPPQKNAYLHFNWTPLTRARAEPLKVIARLLMMPSYGEPMRAERLFLEQAGHMQRARLLQESAPASSYAARGLGEKRKQEEAFESRAHEAAAIAVRQSNEREHLFSICARSISKFMRRVPKKDWLDSQRKRE